MGGTVTVPIAQCSPQSWTSFHSLCQATPQPAGGLPALNLHRCFLAGGAGRACTGAHVALHKSPIPSCEFIFVKPRFSGRGGGQVLSPLGSLCGCIARGGQGQEQASLSARHVSLVSMSPFFVFLAFLLTAAWAHQSARRERPA